MERTDPVLARLDRVDQAAQQLYLELGLLRRRMRITRTLHEAGLPLFETLAQSPAPACHESVVNCMERYAEALHDYRSAIVRHLVEEEGWSLSDIAQRTGASRQVVSRLYHAPEIPRTGVRPCLKLQLRGAARGSSGAR